MLYPDSLTQLLTDSSQPVVSLFINLDTGGQALSANKIKLNSYAKQIRDQLLANHPDQAGLLKQVEACLSIAPKNSLMCNQLPSILLRINATISFCIIQLIANTLRLMRIQIYGH